MSKSPIITIPAINNKNFLNVLVETENSSTIISVAAIYKNVPIEILRYFEKI